MIDYRYGLNKLNNLIKKTIITVPWEKFQIVDGGTAFQRNLVEAFVNVPNNISEILVVMPIQVYGYMEYANITRDQKQIACGQVISRNGQNSQNGYMNILIIHM